MNHDTWLLFWINVIGWLFVLSQIMGNIIKLLGKRLDAYLSRNKLIRIPVLIRRLVLFFITLVVSFCLSGIAYTIAWAIEERGTPQNYELAVAVIACWGCGLFLFKFKNGYDKRFRGYYGLLELAFAEGAAYVACSELIISTQDTSGWLKLITAIYFCARGFENCSEGKLIARTFESRVEFPVDLAAVRHPKFIRLNLS